MNSFHWHLTDAPGWRIEIKKYPKLTEVGSWRKASAVGPVKWDDWAHQEIDGIPHFGFYTQEDVREIVAYARDPTSTSCPRSRCPAILRRPWLLTLSSGAWESRCRFCSTTTM